METNNFQWTDELVKEYGKFCVINKSWLQWEDFKQSKVKKEEDTYHKCKYCGAMVWGESDEGCYANPNNKSHIDIGSEEKTKEEPKQWEILSLKMHDGSVIYKSSYTYPECFQTLINAKEFPIHSVKRLSDGEVIEVNKTHVEDKTTKHDWIVSELTVKDNRCFANGVNIMEEHLRIIPPPPKESPLPIKVEIEQTYWDSRLTKMDANGYFREYRLKIYPDKEIPEEKYEPIKKAIESVLRNDSELTEQNDLWCIADILSRIWHYGGMKVETSNERVIYGILNKLDLYPTTEEKILMRPDWSDKFLEHNKWPNDKGLPQKYFTKDELLEAQQKAFEAARQIDFKDDKWMKHKTFNDYIQSLNK